ncbi:MAG: hypothetical protein KatS3mg081_1539 [Gemmatimonadales bacterium]|nr:MAG: hypothetical protein KatS3mg081_1539 [Gemmatimonadales bacterium]
MAQAMLISMLLLVAVPAILVAVGAAVHLKEQRERRSPGEAGDAGQGGCA